jgi:two-component system nitrate/nitrite response regulator NarL
MDVLPPSLYRPAGTPRTLADEPHEIGAETRPSEQSISVCLISDRLIERAGLRQTLDGSCIVLVGEAATREEAVALVSRERPNVVVVDLDLQSDTFECIADLVSAAPGSRVIVLSDRARSADHPRLVELGASGLVLRHERPDVLIKAIKKVHAGEIWLDRTSTAVVLARVIRRRQAEDGEAAKIATLTRREREVIVLIGEGLKNNAIAERLFISEATVRNHLTSILDKLGLSDRFELAVYAFRQGLVQCQQNGALPAGPMGK